MKLNLLLLLRFWSVHHGGFLCSESARFGRRCWTVQCAVGFDKDPAELPANKVVRQAMFWWRCGDPTPVEYDYLSKERGPLQTRPRAEPKPGNWKDRQYGNFRHKAGGFGPEIGLARRLMEKQGRPLSIIKVAFNGTGISNDWKPDSGACYRALIEQVRKASAAAQASGIILKPRALVWWNQGEKDSRAAKAAAYEKNLERLVDMNTKFHDGKAVLAVADALKALAAGLPGCHPYLSAVHPAFFLYSVKFLTRFTLLNIIRPPGAST